MDAEDIQSMVTRREIVVMSTFDKWMRGFLSVLSVCTIGILLLLLVELQNLEEQNYRNRAVGCRILVVGGHDLSKEGDCLSKEVLQYFDPQTGSAR